MNKKIFQSILLVALISASGISCKKWLRVQPQDKFLDNQIFSSELAATTALNGLYLQLGSNNLYGQNLSMGAVDIFAQAYSVPSTNVYYNFGLYNYSDATVQATIANTWQSAYATIMNANEFLANLTRFKGQSNIRPLSDSLMRGEAIAIRALLHFDMLRLFGPMYNSGDSTLKSIPYYTQVSSAVSPLYPANAVIDSILNDLSAAEHLMVNDPVIVSGSDTTVTGDPSKDIWRLRYQYLNYYAVKGLEARVNMYRGDSADALTDAQVIINQADPLFPWVSSTSILSDKDNPPRVMATECLFALYNPNLYNNYTALFAPTLLDANILSANPTRLNSTYESNTNDYRLNPTWILAPTSNKTYKTFYKFADVVASARSFRFLQSMIRKSEMYLIAAECDKNTTEGLGYLNTERFHRGLAALAATANVTTEIKKEYMKEFYGEGQLFYYYKRTNTFTLGNGSAAGGNVTLSKGSYVVPLPISETQYRSN